MPKKNLHSQEDWQTLYQATIAFKQQAPWAWMYDSDMFGVQNPETGEVGYCCVMGNLGEVFALAVYLGAEGLASYRFLQESGGPSEEMTWRDMQKLLSGQLCLMASLEDRNELDRQDMNVINKLKLKFRGRNAYPMFRKYQPGYAPYFLSPIEVRFLAVALQQTTEMAARCQNHPDWRMGRERDQMLIRTMKNGQWQDTWQHPEAWEPPQAKPVIDEVLLARIRQAGFSRNAGMIVDCIMLPTEIRDAEPPYFPYMFFALSQEGMALGMEMCKPGEEERVVPEKFMAFMMQMTMIPQVLQVGSQKAYDLLAPIAEKLQFPIQLTEEHPMLNFFLDSMGEYLMGGR